MLWRRPTGLIVVVLAALVAAAILLPHSSSGLRALLTGLGPAAPLLALAAWILLTPAMFPGAVLAAAGGLAFGALGGSVIALGGAVAGGLAAFTLARTAAGDPVERLVQRSPRLTHIHTLLERRGFAAILAARLMPGVPVTALHYAAGVSPVRPRAFVSAIAIGALLRTVPYAILGQGLSSGSTVTILIAGSTAGLGGVGAAVLVRQLRRTPCDSRLTRANTHAVYSDRHPQNPGAEPRIPPHARLAVPVRAEGHASRPLRRAGIVPRRRSGSHFRAPAR